MKNKIVLIQPKNTLSLNIYPPLGLVSIGSVLKSNGYDVVILSSGTNKDIVNIVLNECRDALLVGFTILTPEIPDAVHIAKIIKENYDIPIVWGGWHATLFPDQMANSDLVDKVVVDEGDLAILDIADNYKKNGYVKNDNKIIRNPKKLDMTKLPTPDYNLLGNIETFITGELCDKFMEYDNREIRWLPYQASRGCPYECTFCINVVTDNRKYRTKDSKQVADEIEHLVKTYNLNHVKIIDDLLFVKIGWVKEIAQEIINRKLNITWDSEVRVDMFNDRLVNDEALDLFVRSGMNEVNFGIESGSEKSLETIKKRITPKIAYNAVKKCSEFGVVSRCSFIIDIPGEEPEDIYKTVRLAQKIRGLKKTMVGMHTYRPYPGSELCDELLKNKLIKQPEIFEDWSKEEYIQDFTYASAKRLWQKNYKLSSSVSFFQNLESGFWLFDHQIDLKFFKIINNFFIDIARLRNRFIFYSFPLDKYLYEIFLNYWKVYRENKLKRITQNNLKISKFESATLSSIAEGDLGY